MHIKFKNTYAQLNSKFYSKVYPTAVKRPQLIQFNYQLADELGINFQDVSSCELAEIFSGNKILEGSKPIALVYAGHQFGHFVSQLGDGRAILLGEVINKNGELRDIQLKGSGRTPYSRQGDGRAALGPVIREYIISEALHNLRIRTTRSLAIITTGENVFRETILPGAILTRVAASHIRIGTFEYFSAQQDTEALKILTDYALDRHYPEIKRTPNPYYSFLKEVMKSQILLIVDWMRVGFIHGVMNTDNISISGETIDYGPCAFMDYYHSEKVFSAIDYYGRYGFGNQVNIGLWNIIKLYQALLPILNVNTNVDDLILLFTSTFNQKWLEMIGKKIGIVLIKEEDQKLIQNLLNIMQENEMDYTLTFRYLFYAVNNDSWPYEDFFNVPVPFKDWVEKWRIRFQEQGIETRKLLKIMSQVNPVYIPRNHNIERVIKAANTHNDFAEMKKLIRILSTPYKEHQALIEYMKPPLPDERVSKTFCGT